MDLHRRLRPRLQPGERGGRARAEGRFCPTGDAGKGADFVSYRVTS